jgi:hypothetical protein
MGGKLFSPDSERVTTDEMNTVFEEIKQKIQSFCLEVHLTVSLASKLDHGDVDILVLTGDKNFVNKAKEALGSNIVRDSKNGNQYSVLYKPDTINKQVHVDLIFTADAKKYGAMRTYLSYNDFSNVIGIFAKRLNFIYADDGFYKAFKDDKGQWHYLFVTHNLKDGLRILGYDSVLNKFDSISTVEEIIEFAISSPLLGVEMFTKLTNRERDLTKRRPASKMLVDKITQMNKQATITDEDHFFKKLYPHHYEKYIQEKNKINKELSVESVYNGKWVMDTFKLKPGPVLGKVLAHIKNKFKDTLDLSDEEVVKAEVDQFLRKPEIASMLTEITYKSFFSLKEGVKWDAMDGLGSVPWNQEVKYRGFVKEMTPDEFLGLALGLPTGHVGTSKDIENLIAGGRSVGQPFLTVKWIPETKKWQVTGHEGRNRSLAIKALYPNEKMPVHIFPRDMRAHDLTDEMKNAAFIPEKP